MTARRHVPACVRMKPDDPPARTLSADPAQRLVDAIALPIGRWGRSESEARLLFCNAPYARWAGRPSDELVGRTLSDLYGPAAWAAARGAFAAAFGGAPVSYERRLTHQGAAARWARVQVFPDRKAAGEVEAVYTIAFDIHQDVMEREQLQQARQRLSRFTEHIPFPLTYVDARTAAVRQPGVPARRGHAGDRDAGAADRRSARPQTLGRAQALLRPRAGRRDRAVHAAGALPHRPEPGPARMRTSYVPDLDDDGAVQGVYTVTIDVHDLTEAQQRLARSAERDALTDALSRRTMMERLDAAAASCDTHPVGLFFIDLDRFKALNDVHGHAAGDALLVALARTLQQAVRAEDSVGRFGGDGSWCWRACATPPAPKRWLRTCCRRCAPARRSASTRMTSRPASATRWRRTTRRSHCACCNWPRGDVRGQARRQGPGAALQRLKAAASQIRSATVNRSRPVRSRKARVAGVESSNNALTSSARRRGRGIAQQHVGAAAFLVEPATQSSSISASSTDSICSGSVRNAVASSCIVHARALPLRARCSAATHRQREREALARPRPWREMRIDRLGA